MLCAQVANTSSCAATAVPGQLVPSCHSKTAMQINHDASPKGKCSLAWSLKDVARNTRKCLENLMPPHAEVMPAGNGTWHHWDSCALCVSQADDLCQEWGLVELQKQVLLPWHDLRPPRCWAPNAHGPGRRGGRLPVCSGQSHLSTLPQGLCPQLPTFPQADALLPWVLAPGTKQLSHGTPCSKQHPGVQPALGGQ